jgi:hypothetical protein
MNSTDDEEIGIVVKTLCDAIDSDKIDNFDEYLREEDRIVGMSSFSTMPSVLTAGNSILVMYTDSGVINKIIVKIFLKSPTETQNYFPTFKERSIISESIKALLRKRTALRQMETDRLREQQNRDFVHLLK